MEIVPLSANPNNLVGYFYGALSCIMASWLIVACVRLAMAGYYYTATFADLRRIRSAFRGSQLRLNCRGTTLEHVENGTLRNSAVSYAYWFCKRYGLEPYWISPRMKYVREGVRYFRKPYWYTDDLEETEHPVRENDLLLIYDVDYYLTTGDFARWASCFRPMLLFTFSPETVCSNDSEMSFRSCADNHVDVSYSAGGNYHHKLWDFDCEYIGFQVGLRHYLYAVERKRLSATREFIMLIPKSTCPMRSGVDPLLLKRREFFSGGIQIATFKRVGQEPVVHFAPESSYVASKVELKHVENCRMRLKVMSKPTAHVVERHFRELMPDYLHSVSTLFHYYLNTNDKLTAHTILGYSRDVDTLEEPPSAYFEAHTPVDPNGSAPLRSRANDEWCTEDRISKVRSYTEFPAALQERLDKFLLNFQQIDPVPAEVVEANQNRPSQRMLREQVGPILGDASFKIKSFQKQEAYPSLKAPRNITTVDAGFKTVYSAYTYALFDYCQQFEWFAPGKEPLVIAERVLDLASMAPLSEADYSKFDGSKSPAAVHIERSILNLCFPDGTATELFDKQLYANATTANGVNYNVGTTRLSGSPDTTILNTLINAFVAYSTFEHYDFLVSGDDIVYCDDNADIAKTAVELGYKLEVVRTPKYPTFLGRVYHNLPDGAESIYDVRRFSAKSPVITSLQVPPHVAISRRAQGYLKTDPNTPIVTEWCHTMLKRYGKCDEDKYDASIDMPYYAMCTSPYPVSTCDLTDVACELLDCEPSFIEHMAVSFLGGR